MAISAQIMESVGTNTRVAAKLCPEKREFMVRTGMVFAVLLFGFLVLSGDGIESNFDHNYDFSKIHTFSVQVGTPWGNGTSESAVLHLVTNALMTRGWALTIQGSADAQVVIHGTTQTLTCVDSFYSHGWQGYGWAGIGPTGASPARGDEYAAGTMVVDVFAAKNKELLFRGVGRDEISDEAACNPKNLKKELDKMFQNFPPKIKVR